MATPQRAPDPDPRPVAEVSRLYTADDVGRRRLVPTGAGIPDVVWAPLAAAALILVAGALALLVGQPLLFASLGPTAFMEAHRAKSNDSTLYNTLVGHGAGILVGYVLVWAFALAPPTAVFRLHHLTPARMWASVIAVGLTLLLQLVSKAYHPPAAATVLLITLGGFAFTRTDVMALVAGIVAVAFTGEGLRVLRARVMPPNDPWDEGGAPQSAL